MFFQFSSPALPIALWIYFTSLWEIAHRKLFSAATTWKVAGPTFIAALYTSVKEKISR